MARKRQPKIHRPGATAAIPVAPSAWIISPLWDSLLFIGAPIVVIAAFLPLRGMLSSEQIAILLLAFFTFGHHFPTFLRAYGDRELFERYRWRFLLAPPLIFAAALWSGAKDLHGLLIFVSAWDIWHVLMQHYGFMRIYDSKSGAISETGSWLDWAFSISWYLTLILASPHYLHNLLSRAYVAGVPLFPIGLVNGLEFGMKAVTAALTLAYVGYHLNQWRRGRPVSWRKLAMVGIFLSATYYLYVFIDDFLVGFTVWSAFHCIQYYGIVWVYNRNRVDRNGPVTRFVRFLFRPSAALALFYLALIFAYGGINLLTGQIANGVARSLLLAFVFTSNALHYYYDGFIWKVREAGTRSSLNISTVGEAESTGPSLRALVSRIGAVLRPANRGWVQAAYLAGIVLVLASLETWRPNSEIAMSQSLAAASPTIGEAQFNLGTAQWRAGQLDDAIVSLQKAKELMPGTTKVLNNLGGVYYEKGMLEQAIAEYEQALAIGEEKALAASTPGSPLMPGGVHSTEANPLNVRLNLADALGRKGRPEDAIEQYRAAIAQDPLSARAHANLGATLGDLGRYEEGRDELEKALRIDPAYGGAHINLASILAQMGDPRSAALHYQAALSSDDERVRRAAQSGLFILSQGGQ